MRIISYPIANETMNLDELIDKLDEEHDEFINAIEFYDYDNIANKWVLPKIDFENSTIKIAQTSLIK